MNSKIYFGQKLMRIMEYIEENCKEGDYLHLSNEFKTLFEMMSDLFKTSDERCYEYITHLRRCIKEYERRINNVKLNKGKKYVCNRCGRKVAGIVAHQKRAICVDITAEKKASCIYKTELAEQIIQSSAITIQRFWREKK